MRPPSRSKRADNVAKEKIFVAGHRGMVGSAIVRQLELDPRNEIVTVARSEVDLMNQAEVHDFFGQHKFDQVYLAAAKVGGIYANDNYPADFIYENLIIQANVINAAHHRDVQKLLFLGSSCIYPRMAEQPINEDALLTGPLEPTNESYAIAKIAGIKMCESYNRQHKRDYRSVMPTNLYGPGDNYHPENSHVIPALIRRFHEAKISQTGSVKIWGTGSPRREFLYVDDMARACIYIMNLKNEIYAKNTHPRCSHVNVGAGQDISIRELAKLISEIVGYEGNIHFDESFPDGAPKKLMDSSKLFDGGFRNRFGLKPGLTLTYEWFLNNHISGYSR